MDNKIDKVLKNYNELVRNDDFVIYEKNLAKKIISALSNEYSKSEDKLVQNIERIINDIGKLSKKDPNNQFEISTESVFIHGNRCQVNFDYYKENTKPIELGDLIFIISIVFNQTKYFEKFTITQFKKDYKNNGKWFIKKDNGEKQLFLLSRFPSFEVTKGFLKGKVYSLPNYSGCLGSYGLLFYPGDFAFIIPSILESYIKYQKNINSKELLSLIVDIKKYEEIEYFVYDLYPDYCNFRYWPYNFLGNYHESLNTYDFSHKYLTSSIGEPTIMHQKTYNRQARKFLYDLFKAIEKKAEKNNLFELKKFVNRFFGNENYQSEEFDFDDGGLGIIHTIIDFGEG